MVYLRNAWFLSRLSGKQDRGAMPVPCQTGKTAWAGTIKQENAKNVHIILPNDLKFVKQYDMMNVRLGESRSLGFERKERRGIKYDLSRSYARM